MAESFPNHPLFTLRTNALAGRGPEQDKLRAAVEQLRGPNAATRLFYIAGAGGMGKTRLLEWLGDALLPELADSQPLLLCTRIIDFYSSHVRINLDLIEAIAKDVREGLDNSERADEAFR